MKLRVKAIIVLWLFVLTLASLPATAAINQATFKDFVYGGDSYDYPWTMEPLPNGGFVVITTTQSFNQSHLQRYDGSLWITKIGADGRIEISTLYTPPKPSIFYDSTLLPDESIVVVGTTGDYRSAFITRISSNGTVIFYEYLNPGVPVYSIGLTGVEYYEGKIVAVGYFYDLSIYKAIQWLIILDLNGNVISSIGLDLGAPYYYPIAFALSIDRDLAIIAGFGFTNPGFIIGYNLSSNSLAFAYMIGNSAGEDYYGVIISSDAIYLVGTTDDFGGEDAAVISLSTNGTVNWGVALKTNGVDRLFGVFTDTNYVYVSGWAQPDPITYRNDTLIAKLSIRDGSLEWYKVIGSTRDDWAYRIYADELGNVYTVGGYGSPAAKDDVIILKLNKNGNLPYCELVRNDTLQILPYTPSVSPITPAIIVYTNSTTPLSLVQSTPKAQVYRVCNTLVGGSTLDSNVSIPIDAVLLVAVVPLIIAVSAFAIKLLSRSQR